MLTSSERIRVLSRLFTRPVLSSVARTGDWRRSVSFLTSYKLLGGAEPRPLSSLFEDVWSEMRQIYRNEYFYKNEIDNRVIFGRHSPKTAALHVELPVGRSIVDLAVFNGTSTAYEIKTEYDSARRLETQTSDYLKAFNYVYIVTHERFASSFAAAAAPRVGILTLTRAGRLHRVRESIPNSAALDQRTMFRCLRRNEYVAATEKLTGKSVDLPNGLISGFCENAFYSLSTLEAHSVYTAALRERKTDLKTVSFVATLPQSLRALGYATPLTAVQRERVLAVLKGEVSAGLC